MSIIHKKGKKSKFTFVSTYFFCLLLSDFNFYLFKSLSTSPDIISCTFYLIINAGEKFGPGDQHLINIVKELNVPTFLLINKIDLISPEKLIEIISFYKDLYDFVEIVPISALKSINVD